MAVFSIRTACNSRRFHTGRAMKTSLKGRSIPGWQEFRYQAGTDIGIRLILTSVLA